MQLDHFSVRTPDLDAVRDFFVDVLELHVGDRPPFKFPGYWLYDAGGGPAIVHLIGTDKAPGDDTGAVDHMAFKGEGARYDEISAKIERLDYPSERRTVPGAGLRQIFVTGPHGVVVELNFPPAA
ncbi:MAG: hypothetical protein OXR84_13290 [Magnetovibrio sp.]|nr:hypothetical protein [Magnetovibrio sp.]